MIQQQRLLEHLLASGVLTQEQVNTAVSQAEKEGKPVESILVRGRLMKSEDLVKAKAKILGVPYVDLSDTTIDAKLLSDISHKAMITYKFVPFAQKDNKLYVAMEEPDNFQSLEAIKFIAKKRGLSPAIYMCSKEAVEQVLNGAVDIKEEIGGALKDFNKEIEEVKKVKNTGDEAVQRFIEEAPVTKVVAVIIRHAIEGHASDIHVEPTEKDLRVRYRIDGKLHTSLVLPMKVHAALTSRFKILSNLKIDESRLPQDGRFSTVIDGNDFDFRVATIPTTFGEKTALRILDKSAGAPSFDELGLWGKNQKIFKEHLNSPHGIILISGPTGSGKSTTLFTALSMLNRPDVNIVTLEDPVEYEIDGVNQTQVHPEINLTFASGLRSLLRQDPDIIMVGEIRDSETAELAVHAALTGHLVISTIHTNNAVGTIPRLTDMGIDPFLLTASLRVLASQRLVGRLCQECKKEVELSPALRQRISEELATVPEEYLTEENQRYPKVIYESPGCPSCKEGQSVGRLAIFEVLPVTRSLRSVINESAKYDTIMDEALKSGYLTMRQDGLLKVLAGQVLYEDVLRVTSTGQPEI